MSEEKVVLLEIERFKNGEILISSPHVPLYSVSLLNDDEILTVAVPILKDTLEKNLGIKILELKITNVLETDEPEWAKYPRAVIAQLAA